MNLRRHRSMVAEHVRASISAAGSSIDAAAEAADMTASELEARLNGDEPLLLEDLVAVGGFLHVDPAEFFEGVNA